MSSINPTQEQINSVVELFTKGQMLEAIDKLEVLANDFPEDALLFNIRGACYAGSVSYTHLTLPTTPYV